MKKRQSVTHELLSLKTSFKWIAVGVGASFLIGALAIGLFLWHLSSSSPQLISIADYRPPIVTRIVMMANGKEEQIAEFFKERRYLVPIEQIPESIIHAFVSAEDDRFYEHQGISPIAIVRAGVANFVAGHVVQGGSTITQQVVKSLFLTPEKKLIRKLKEAILAYRIEKNLSKQQILYLYLNQIYLGHGAYGIMAAAKVYFHKELKQLTIPEIAILAGMPRAPSRYSPFLNPDWTKGRQKYVLKRMRELGYIDEPTYAKSLVEPVKIFHPGEGKDQVAAYMVEHVRRALVQKYGEKTIYEEGLRVEVPSSPALYERAEESLKEGLRSVDKRRGYRGPLRKLPTPEAIEAFLKSQEDGFVKKHMPYQYLLPEGKMALKLVNEKPHPDKVFVEVGEIYPAVVMQVEDSKRVAKLRIGNAEIQLSGVTAGWADPVLSKIISQGDVVLAKITKVSPKIITAELEQDPSLQGAVLSMDARTGEVLSMVGGYDFEKSEFNRATQAQRQPGSAFKPIIYACSLENGFTPASVIVDAPIVYDDQEMGKWKPSNFEDKFLGDISLRQALIKSMNIPTIKVVQALKVPTVVNYAKRLGLNNTEFKPDLSISLGSANISLWDLVQVYSLFPRLGRKIAPIFIRRVNDRDGKVLEENLPKPLPNWVTTQGVEAPIVSASSPTPVPSTGTVDAQPTDVPEAHSAQGPQFPAYPLESDLDQVLDPRVAFVMTHLMKEVVEFGTGARAKVLGRPAAGKTGTTNEYKDAWFMGFTPSVVTGVWVGFDDQQTLGAGETGSNAAIPIWLSFMREATKNYPNEDFIVPQGVTFAWIDQKTGKLGTSGAAGVVREAFIEGTAPTLSVEKGGAGTESDSDFLKEELE